MLAGVGVTHGDWHAVCYFQWHIGACPLCVKTSKVISRTDPMILVQDYENRLAEKNNQRPDPEEQVLIF